MHLRRVRIWIPVALLAGPLIALQARGSAAPAQSVVAPNAAALSPGDGSGTTGGAGAAPGAGGSGAAGGGSGTGGSASTPGGSASTHGGPASTSGGPAPTADWTGSSSAGGASGSAAGGGPASAPEQSANAAGGIDATVSLSPASRPLPNSFIGTSIEYPALHIYTGRDSRHVDPVLVRLLDQLSPHGAPILRIGGNSADQTWYPVRGVIPPKGAYYGLGPDWLATVRGLSQASGARLILGINFAGDRPGLAGTEARALLRGIGVRHVDAFEIGNEPDLYGAGGWFKGPGGQWIYARPPSWNMQSLIADYARWQANLPTQPLAGPSFAELVWLNQLGTFISSQHRLRMVTIHRYPLRGCQHDPSSPDFATIPNLLNDSSSAGMAASIASYVSQSHSARLPFRVDEMNSVACRGTWGVSNTFASALWAVDTLYDFAGIGVDGVNFHMLPGAAYELFSPAQRGNRWSAFVRPEYYGLLFFNRGFPAGARLLRVSVPSGPVKVYATRGRDGHVRVMLVNKDEQNPATVNLHIQDSSGSATLERLLAPNVNSTHGITIAGQSFGSSTTTGHLRGSLQTVQVDPDQSGVYSVSVPAASAALLTR